MTSVDVAVVGAGPAGLAAAWRAARAGRSVVVLEAADRVGGQAGSIEVADQRVDLGSHRLHPSTDSVILAALTHLLGGDLQRRTRRGRIRLAGRWVPFPFGIGDLVRGLPPGLVAGASRDALLRPTRRPRADTFRDVVRAGLGPRVAEAFYEPYARKLFATDPDRLSGELARRRVSAGGPAAVARRALRRSDGPGRSFWYPRRGFGQLTETLADAMVEAGADLRLGCGVTRLDLTGPTPVVGLSDGSSLEAPVVWSTGPVARLPTLVSPEAAEPVRAAAAGLDHRAMVLVYLVVDRSRYTEFDAHYLPEEANPVSRLSEPKNYRDSAEDPPGRTVLCAEVPCWEGDRTWEADPETLGERVRRALLADGLPDPAPVAVEVRRLPRVYPVLRLGFERDLGRLEEWLATFQGLLTLGRPGLFVADNTHHALAMGWAAARCFRPDGSVDRAAWARAREGFRAHVVED